MDARWSTRKKDFPAASIVENWTEQELTGFLVEIGLQQCADAFWKIRLNGGHVQSLTKDYLKSIPSIEEKERKKLLKLVKPLQREMKKSKEKPSPVTQSYGRNEMEDSDGWTSDEFDDDDSPTPSSNYRPLPANPPSMKPAFEDSEEEYEDPDEAIGPNRRRPVPEPPSSNSGPHGGPPPLPARPGAEPSLPPRPGVDPSLPPRLGPEPSLPPRPSGRGFETKHSTPMADRNLPPRPGAESNFPTRQVHTLPTTSRVDPIGNTMEVPKLPVRPVSPRGPKALHHHRVMQQNEPESDEENYIAPFEHPSTDDTGDDVYEDPNESHSRPSHAGRPLPQPTKNNLANRPMPTPPGQPAAASSLGLRPPAELPSQLSVEESDEDNYEEPDTGPTAWTRSITQPPQPSRPPQPPQPPAIDDEEYLVCTGGDNEDDDENYEVPSEGKGFTHRQLPTPPKDFRKPSPGANKPLPTPPGKPPEKSTPFPKTDVQNLLVNDIKSMFSGQGKSWNQHTKPAPSPPPSNVPSVPTQKPGEAWRLKPVNQHTKPVPSPQPPKVPSVPTQKPGEAWRLKPVQATPSHNETSNVNKSPTSVNQHNNLVPSPKPPKVPSVPTQKPGENWNSKPVQATPSHNETSNGTPFGVKLRPTGSKKVEQVEDKPVPKPPSSPNLHKPKQNRTIQKPVESYTQVETKSKKDSNDSGIEISDRASSQSNSSDESVPPLPPPPDNQTIQDLKADLRNRDVPSLPMSQVRPNIPVPALPCNKPPESNKPSKPVVTKNTPQSSPAHQKFRKMSDPHVSKVVPKRERHGSLTDRQLPPAPPQQEDDTMYSFLWYFGEVSRDVSNECIKASKEDGSFLVRKSTKEHPFTLVIFFKGQIFNLPVRRRHDQKYAIGSKRDDETAFANLPGLVEHHHKNEIVLERKGIPVGSVKLTRPPSRPRTI